jgi:hypothetical protein
VQGKETVTGRINVKIFVINNVKEEAKGRGKTVICFQRGLFNV